MTHLPRRSTVLPQSAALVVSATLLLTVAGCGGTSAGSTTAASTNGPSSRASSPAGSSSSTQQPTSCVDPAGDGADADLTGVTITATAADVQITWTTTQAVQSIIESSSTALFSATVVRADGNQVFQLGVKAIDGNLGTPFVFDLSATQQTSTSDPAQVGDSTITATFPATTVTALGPNWTWSADTSVNGTDVDRCPDASGSVLDPPQITSGA